MQCVCLFVFIPVVPVLFLGRRQQATDLPHIFISLIMRTPQQVAHTSTEPISIKSIYFLSSYNPMTVSLGIVTVIGDSGTVLQQWQTVETVTSFKVCNKTSTNLCRLSCEGCRLIFFGTEKRRSSFTIFKKSFDCPIYTIINGQTFVKSVY